MPTTKGMRDMPVCQGRHHKVGDLLPTLFQGTESWELRSADPIRAELVSPSEVMSSILTVQLRKQAQREAVICPRVTVYSSTLAWKIPWTEEPGQLQSLGSLRVGDD